MSKILHLVLFRRYFDEIAIGQKRFEYRAATPFWKRRIEGRQYDEILFRNGYRRNSPQMRVQYRGWTRVEIEGAHFYALQLGSVLSVRFYELPSGTLLKQAAIALEFEF